MPGRRVGADATDGCGGDDRLFGSEPTRDRPQLAAAGAVLSHTCRHDRRRSRRNSHARVALARGIGDEAQQLFVKPDDRWDINNVAQHHPDLCDEMRIQSPTFAAQFSGRPAGAVR